MQEDCPNGPDRHGRKSFSLPPDATDTHEEMVQACLAFLGRGTQWYGRAWSLSGCRLTTEPIWWAKRVEVQHTTTMCPAVPTFNSIMKHRCKAYADKILGWIYTRHTKVSPLLAVLLAGLQVGSFEARAQSAEAPNLIVVMADDLSSNLMDDLLETGYAPNIQQYLIDEGILFENSFVTNSLCCPSRATFLRGEYTHNHRVFSNMIGTSGEPGISWDGWFPKDGVPGRNESTVATWLQAAGYVTGHVGKYLNGYGDAAPEGEPDPKLYIPPGWDDWQGLLEPSSLMFSYKMNDNGTVVTYGSAVDDYNTDVLAERAVQFIDERADSGQRFFLYVGTSAPHLEAIMEGPGSLLDLRIRPAPRHSHLVDGNAWNEELPAWVPSPSFNEADISDKPSCPPDGDPETPDLLCIADRSLFQPHVDFPKIAAQYKTMLASLVAVDDLVGAIMDSLVANGIDGDTIIFFTSDNGWLYGEHRLVGKTVVYEESIRVPLYVRAPDFASGATTSRIVLNNDLAPTLADLAGVTGTHEPDGTSLVPLLEDPQSTDWHRKGFLVEHYFACCKELATYFALRYINETWNFNFVFAATYSDTADPSVITHYEIYNLETDPYQLHSATLGASPLDLLTDYVTALRSCRGESCRFLEALSLR